MVAADKGDGEVRQDVLGVKTRFAGSLAPPRALVNLVEHDPRLSGWKIPAANTRPGAHAVPTQVRRVTLVTGAGHTHRQRCLADNGVPCSEAMIESGGRVFDDRFQPPTEREKGEARGPRGNGCAAVAALLHIAAESGMVQPPSNTRRSNRDRR